MPAKKSPRKARPVKKPPLPKLTPENRRIMRLVVEGRLPKGEIAERLGADRKQVSAVASLLEKRGIGTNIPGSNKPPMETAKAVLMFEVLLQVAGEAPTRCTLKAEGITGTALTSFINRHPVALIEARNFRNGYFWRKAREEMADRIKAIEDEYKETGRKYNPSVSLSSELARKRLKAIKSKTKK